MHDARTRMQKKESVRKENKKLMHASGYHESNVCVWVAPPPSHVILPALSVATARCGLQRQRKRLLFWHSRPVVCDSQVVCEFGGDSVSGVPCLDSTCRGFAAAAGLAAGEAVGEEREEGDDALLELR